MPGALEEEELDACEGEERWEKGGLKKKENARTRARGGCWPRKYIIVRGVYLPLFGDELGAKIRGGLFPSTTQLPGDSR